MIALMITLNQYIKFELFLYYDRKTNTSYVRTLEKARYDIDQYIDIDVFAHVSSTLASFMTITQF